MNKNTSLALLIVGIVLLFFDFKTAESFSTSLSGTFTRVQADKIIWLIVLGVIALLTGGADFKSSRRNW